MHDLKPCPFCNGAPVQLDHMLHVQCTECGAATRDFTGTLGEFQKEHDAAAAEWNKRSDFFARDVDPLSAANRDPKTQNLGQMVLSHAIDNRITNGELVQSILALQLFIFVNAAEGNVGRALEAMEGTVKSTIEAVRINLLRQSAAPAQR